MRIVLSTLLVLMALLARAANPSYEAFLGTNGITVRSNPPQGKIIIDGAGIAGGGGDSLWTNEPAGRLRPIDFGNRVEMQKVLTVGTNTGSFVTINDNDIFLGFRDLTNPSEQGWDPRFSFGVHSNASVSKIETILFHLNGYSLLDVTDDNSNSSLVSYDAPPDIGPSLLLIKTNGATVAYFSDNLFIFDDVSYDWPNVQGGAGTVLLNDGAGNLSWGSGGASCVAVAPQFLGTNVVFDGSLSSCFQFNPATGPETNYVFTNIQSGQTIRLSTFVTNGATVRLKANLVDIPASWYVGNNGTAGNLNSNTPSVVYISRDDLVPATNVVIWTRDFESVAGSGITFTTNFSAGTVTFSSSGGGDSVWTNDNGTLKPIDLPTNILLRVNVPDNGTGTNFYFDSRVYRTNAATKLFSIYNGGSNAVTVGPYGGLFMGRGNPTPSPGIVLAGLYDTALGETNQQELFMLSRNSTVGYSGSADMLIDTNYGALILTATKEGGTKFSRFAIQAGAGINPQDFNTFSMQALVDGATYFLVDPNFTTLQPTNYLFSSSVRITNTHTLLSLQNSNFPVLEVDGVGDLRKIKKIAYTWPSAQGAAQSTLVNDGAGNLAWQTATAVPGVLTGTTNFFNLSVQAAHLPSTNMPSIDGSWPAWETVYAETNSEGSRATLDASWQFMVPTDYATNSLKLLINYSLLGTNGPNTSNVVWGASILVIRAGTTNNVHTNLFGTTVKGSNDWIAKYDGTNIITNIVLDLGVNSLLMARDLAIIKVLRFPTEDTFGGAVALHGLQLEYKRP